MTKDIFSVGLVFVSRDLDPITISNILSIEPTSTRKRGDLVPNNSGRRWAFGMWRFDLELIHNDTLEHYLILVLDLLESHSDEFKKLSSFGHTPEIWCGIYGKDFGTLMTITSSIMSRLSSLGADLKIDAYNSSSVEES